MQVRRASQPAGLALLGPLSDVVDRAAQIELLKYDKQLFFGQVLPKEGEVNLSLLHI